MVAKGRKVEDAQRNQRDHPGIDEHSEHQPLVHDGEHLPALPDQTEPLGPWRDESGRWSVHRAAVESLDFTERGADNGASGSAFASRIGFVTGLAATTAGLSTDFF